jgi:hypothetical protein
MQQWLTDAASTQPDISVEIFGETTVTIAPASINVPIFLVATSPPPTTVQCFPFKFKNIG